MHPVGDESAGESLEEPIELQSGYELSGSEDEARQPDEEMSDAEVNRWLDELDNEDHGGVGHGDAEGEPEDSEEPERSTARRPEDMEDVGHLVGEKFAIFVCDMNDEMVGLWSLCCMPRYCDLS